MMKFVEDVRGYGLVAVAALPLWVGYAQTPPPLAPAPAPKDAGTAAASYAPNVAEVVKLTKAGLGEEVVLAYVKNSKSPYRLSADDVLALKTAGISSPVLTAMLTHDSPAQNNVEQRPAQPVAVPTSVPPPPPAGTAPSAPQAPPVPATTPPAPTVTAQTPPPPPPQVEVIPVAPGPDYYWNDGYWAWRGGAYVWIGGGWIIRPPGIYWGGRWGGHWGGRGHWR